MTTTNYNLIVHDVDGVGTIIPPSTTSLTFRNSADTADNLKITDAGVFSMRGANAPATNDGAALGSASVSWSDLFLATGGVINFNNGDVTLTHSSNALTMAGGNLIFTATAATETDNIDASLTVTAATSGTRRLVHGSITLTPTSTFSVTGSGSMAATRGLITISAGKTFVDGFLYGAEGRIVLDGTMAESSAGRITGVLGKLALGTGTITSGQASAVWGDVTGNPTLTVNDEVYVGRWTNSMSAGKKVEAFGLYYGQADFLFEFSADGGIGNVDWAIAGAVGGSQSHKLKVNLFGTTFYIPLNTA